MVCNKPKTVVELYEIYDWTQNALARDGEGNGLSSDLNNPKVASFCVAGAIIRVYGWEWHERGDAAKRLGDVVQKHHPQFHRYSINDFNHIVEWNNHPNRTKEEVVELCREAGI